MHVAIVNNQSIIRLGMKYIVQDWMQESIVHFTEDISELFQLLSTQPMDIIILDIDIPDGNNFHAIQPIKDIQESVKILVLSAYDEMVYALRYIDSGADGYLQKNSEVADINEALNAVCCGQKYISRKLKTFLLHNRLNGRVQLHDNPLENLTNRELEVCQLLIEGKGVGEIAKALFIHTSTVGTYKSKIFEKLNARNIKELMDVVSTYRVDVN